MTTLLAANRQWESRPADQRFGSLKAMFDVAQHDKTTATVEKIKANALRVAALSGDVVLLNKDRPATMTNWAFEQVSRIAKAPPAFLRTLSADTAAKCIQEGLARHSDADDEDGGYRQILFSDKGKVARAATSDKYGRVYNADLIRELMKLEAAGPWQPAPEAFDGSRGLYLGDRDMFAFMVDNERRIFETDKGGGLGRGFFLRNNEVGNGAYDITSFLYEYVCGNHRVWGASAVQETRVIHIGGGRFEKVMETMKAELSKYSAASAKDDEAKILSMRKLTLGKTKADVVSTIAKMKIDGLGKNLIGEAYDLAEKRVDWYGAPNSLWGFNGGLTEIARDKTNGDERHTIEVAASKVQELVTA